MGTKVQLESYLPGYYSMRDLNEDSNSCSWPLYYADETVANGQYCNGLEPRSVAETYSTYATYDKEAMRRTMLEHEAIFKSQVYELHRAYRIQRDLMDELKRKELNRNRVDMSLSSSPLASQITYEDARKWHVSGFPLANSTCARPSISGVEDNGHSPISSRKGSNSQICTVPSQNGDSSKDVEVLGVRPMKVRRKMIDLQLPADEYIDTEEIEEVKDNKVFGTLSYLPNGNLKVERQKISHQGDSLRSGSGMRSTNGLADLNEDVKVQETNGSAYELWDGKKTKSPSLSKETSFNSLHGRENVPLNYPHLEERGSRRGWLPQVQGAGHHTGRQKSASPFLQPDKSPLSSQPMQVLFKTADQSKLDTWRERTFIDLEADTRAHEIFRESYVESSVASNTHRSNPINSPDSLRPWNGLSSRENPSSSLAQNLASVQIHPFLSSSETLSNNSQRHRPLGGWWHPDCNFRANPSFGNSNYPNRNGFYHGSSTVSKEHPLNSSNVNYNHLNCRSNNNAVTAHFRNHGTEDLYKGSNGSGIKFARNVNLNEAVPPQGTQTLDGGRKNDEHLAPLPWLRPKPACKSEMTNGQRDRSTGDLSMLSASMDRLAEKDDVGKSRSLMWSQSLKSVSSSNKVETKKIDASHYLTNSRILGCPIFNKSCNYKDEPSLVIPSVSVHHQLNAEENKALNRVLDINLPCDPAVLVSEGGQLTDKGTDTKVAASHRHQIDLNLSVNEDEDSFTLHSGRADVKVLVIDLEALPAPETEEDDVCGEKSPNKAHEEPLTCKDENSVDELVQVAAEAIVAISSFCHHNNPEEVACSSAEASGNILEWFAETINSFGENLHKRVDAFSWDNNNMNNEQSSSEEIDHFESMTLKLPEVKEDEYMPKPLVPENLKFEETGAAILPSQRPRRGNARRGRQRRDFQRDILPGLTSLSRHEITEDIQTFGGLMRATGYMWNSGLTRRKNGSTRGRRKLVTANANTSHVTVAAATCPPLVQQLNNKNNEAGLEDRSLTGWGKTTRRPRRQRCPAGNRSAMALT